MGPAWITGRKVPPPPPLGVVLFALEDVHAVTQEYGLGPEPRTWPWLWTSPGGSGWRRHRGAWRAHRRGAVLPARPHGERHPTVDGPPRRGPERWRPSNGGS